MNSEFKASDAQIEMAKSTDLLPPYPAPKGQVWKTNGMSEWVLVPDPDLQFSVSGKVRKKNPTNITPKKKKRKK